ncbi:MAG: nitrate reductase molybdenum cofactor assembly chaperone [Thermoleophilia bacterium]
MNPLDVASLALRYPDAEVLAARAEVARWCAGLPDGPGVAALREFAAWWVARPAEDLQREYVATFDFSRRTSLDLTYPSFGDRRQRGLALLALQRRYADHGMELDGPELPDHLAVMCEFAAVVPQAGLPLLAEFAPAIQLLHLALADAGSAYAGVVGAIGELLPPLSDDQWADVRAMAKDGPPSEDVGLQPFAPPEYMPDAPAPRAPCRAERSVA